MLTKGDDYPIHQTADPIATSGTDRNFYDRYFFNGYLPGGDGFFAIAFGIYPHLNVADAHISILRNGVQTSLHASKTLHMERWDIVVGPIRIEIVEPLKILRVTVAETNGISADLTFTGRAFPIEEPRFQLRNGPRTVMDVTRMTQNGAWSGWISVDGARTDYDPATAKGTRDRSWGVRPIGASDPQPIPPLKPPQFYWLWAPTNFADQALFFHVNDDALGRAWNTRAVLVPDGASVTELLDLEECSFNPVYSKGARRIATGLLTMKDAAGRIAEAHFETNAVFQMKGIGYTHPEWGHGHYKGELAVAREDWTVADLNPLDPTNLHVQAISKVTLIDFDGGNHVGTGILEQLILGPHAPSGFKDILDPA